MSQKLLILVGCSALIFACSPSPTGGARKGDAQGSGGTGATTGLDWSTGGGTGAATTGNSTGAGTATAGNTTGAGNATGSGNATGGGTATGGGNATGGSATGSGTNQLCTPQMYKCNGTVLAQCNLDGTAWNDIAGCKAGTVCDPIQGKCVCQPQCTGKVCGDNGCGGSCGNCPAGQQCSNGQCGGGSSTVGNANCVAAGTGVQVGSKAKDVNWTTSENQKLNLHSFCGNKKAVLAIEAAAW